MVNLYNLKFLKNMKITIVDRIINRLGGLI
jgi:hypothetical protein